MFNFNVNFMLYDFKYADLLDDDVFKLVFGRESTKDVMIEFLNQVIPDRKIVDLEFIDKEMHPVERDAKGVVYDMFCKTDSGARIIVEVQRRKQPFYPERALYYSTFQIQRQVEAGADSYDFLPVYVINILNFKMDCRLEGEQVYPLGDGDGRSSRAFPHRASPRTRLVLDHYGNISAHGEQRA